MVSVEPAPRSISAPLDGSLSVRFDRAIDRGTVIPRRSFWAFGKWSGTVDGTFRFSNEDRTVSLVPARPLIAGESVTVVLSNELRGADGEPIRSSGYSFQFWVRTREAAPDYERSDRLATRTMPAQSSRAYGGVATDFDGDGRPDLTIVNEDTADLRVFLGQGDGTFADFLDPPTPVGRRASPSEPNDFDRDGHGGPRGGEHRRRHPFGGPRPG